MPTPVHDVPPPHTQRKAFASIDIASDGTIWAVDGVSTQLSNGDAYQVTSDRVMAKVAVGSRTEVWGIDHDGHPVKLDWTPEERLPSGWTRNAQPLWRDMREGVGDARLTDIDVAGDGTICGLDQNGDPLRWNGFQWEAMGGGRVAHISVGSHNSIWGIDGDGIVQQWQSPHGDRRAGITPARWQALPPLPGDGSESQRAVSISVGSDDVLWAVGTGKHIFQYDSGAWKSSGWGPVTQIAGSDSYNLIGLMPTATDSDNHAENQIWRSNFGPLGVPLRTLPPPPPPVATFARWWGVAGTALNTAPAIAAYNRKVYFATKDNDTRGWLWLGALQGPQPDNPDIQTGPGSPGFEIGSSPALAPFKGALYCAFQGRDSGHALCVTRSYDGDTFFPPASIPGVQIGSTPALAEFNGRLYCAFQANDSSHALVVTSSGDGQDWSAPQVCSGILIGGPPTLAAFNGRLYCAFQANDPSNTLFVTSCSDGQDWVSPARGYAEFPVGSAPALTAFEGRLYCAYGANDASQRLCVITSADGENWEPPFRPELVALPITAAPALCALEHALYVGFCSNTGGPRMFYASALGTRQPSSG